MHPLSHVYSNALQVFSRPHNLKANKNQTRCNERLYNHDGITSFQRGVEKHGYRSSSSSGSNNNNSEKETTEAEAGVTRSAGGGVEDTYMRFVVQIHSLKTQPSHHEQKEAIITLSRIVVPNRIAMPQRNHSRRFAFL